MTQGRQKSPNLCYVNYEWSLKQQLIAFSGEIFFNAQPIIEERIAKQKLLKDNEPKIVAEEPKSKIAAANEYTNLYWQPDNYSATENEYEIVEDNSSKQSILGSGGLLRSMRESLLRELRRDLNKITRSSNENGSTSKAAKDELSGTASPGSITLPAPGPSGATATENPKFVNVRPGIFFLMAL